MNRYFHKEFVIAALDHSTNSNPFPIKETKTSVEEIKTFIRKLTFEEIKSLPIDNLNAISKSLEIYLDICDCDDHDTVWLTKRIIDKIINKNL